jgi:hypothetical protein
MSAILVFRQSPPAHEPTKSPVLSNGHSLNGHVETRGWRNDQPPPRVTIAEAGATIALSRSVEVWMASSVKPSTPRPEW